MLNYLDTFDLFFIGSILGTFLISFADLANQINAGKKRRKGPPKSAHAKQAIPDGKLAAFLVAISLFISSNKLLVFKMSLAALTFVLAFTGYLDEVKSKAKNAASGKLPAMDIIRIPTIDFGTIRVRAPVQNLFDIDGEKNFRVRLVNGFMTIDIDLNDRRGNHVASIRSNIWEKPRPGLDYNFDNSGYEIVSGDIVIFQIDYRNDTAFARGLICGMSGNCYFGNEEGVQPVPRSWGLSDFPIPPQMRLKKLFKYPRERFFGVRN